MTRAAAAAALIAALWAVQALDQGVVRTAVVFAALGCAPGLALPAPGVAGTVAASLVVDTLAVTGLLALGAYTPDRALAALSVVTLAAAAVSGWRAWRRRPPALELDRALPQLARAQTRPQRPVAAGVAERLARLLAQ